MNEVVKRGSHGANGANAKTSAASAAVSTTPRRELPPRPVKPPRPPLARVVDLLGSFGLAVSLLLLLFVLTLLGTLEQRTMSLYDVQKKYFESVFLVADVFGVPVPLPGASLVMGLLSVNLIVGGVIRIRKATATVGVIVAHVGILMLFVGGLVESLWADKGQMTLMEGTSSDQFHSYYEWEITVAEARPDGGTTEHVIGDDRLAGLDPEDRLRIASEALPFDVRIAGWTRNAEVVSARDAEERIRTAHWTEDRWRRYEAASGPDATKKLRAEAASWARNEEAYRDALALGGGDVAGEVIWPLDPGIEAERNVAAAYVAVAPKAASDGGERRRLLEALSDGPWTVTVGGRAFAIDLHHRRWTVPFTVRLKDEGFVKRLYPGTGMPQEFSSNVVMTENGASRDVHITMNAPLRHKGYTFYQSGFRDAQRPGERMSSTFSVVRNPSDRMPIYSWCVIAAGLLVHFVIKLIRHVSVEAKAKAAAAEAAAGSTAS